MICDTCKHFNKKQGEVRYCKKNILKLSEDNSHCDDYEEIDSLDAEKGGVKSLSNKAEQVGQETALKPVNADILPPASTQNEGWDDCTKVYKDKPLLEKVWYNPIFKWCLKKDDVVAALKRFEGEINNFKSDDLAELYKEFENMLELKSTMEICCDNDNCNSYVIDKLKIRFNNLISLCFGKLPDEKNNSQSIQEKTGKVKKN
jgi:hypothetical protein